MSQRQVVFVAIDHGTDVERIMKVALSTAKGRGADVHVIRVVPHQALHVDDLVGGCPLEPQGDCDFNTGARLASILQSAAADRVRVRSVTLRGEPEQIIPAYAQLHEATILVAERDYGSPNLWRNGRVVDELARRSPTPLLVLPKQRTREWEEPRLLRILTPIDSSIASAVALRTAVDLSRRHGARLTLVHALEDLPRRMVFSGGAAWQMVRRLPAQVEAAAERLRRRAAWFGADDVDTEVATGGADGALLRIATRSDANLIVMGIAHRSWLDRLLFGSTLRAVLRRTTVPVLVVPVVAGAHAWPNEPVVDQISRRAPNDFAAARGAA